MGLTITKNLYDFRGKTLSLFQSSIFKDKFELKADDEVIGLLRYPKCFSRKAEVEIFNKKYEFKYQNFWGTDIGIYQAGYEMPFSMYSSKKFGCKGILSLEKGESLFFNFNLWKGYTEVKTAAGEQVLFYKSKHGIKLKSLVELHAQNYLFEKNPWIIMLILYINKNRQSSHAAIG